MTLRHLYRDLDGTLTDMSAFTPRIVETQGRAEESAVGSWSVVLDDPYGELDIVGLRNWFIEDDESEDEDRIIFGGFTGAQTIARMQGEAHRKIGPDARVITVQLFDANAFLARIVMKGADTNRPAETDVERMQWLLSTDEADSFGDVTTFVDTAHFVNMDAAPLRGTYFGQIISDCSEQSGKNHYAFYRWHDGARKLTIWYGSDFLAGYVSPFYISNDRADITQSEVNDGTAIVWPLSEDATMERSPERQYCGCYLTYEGGAVYRHNSTTHALIAAGTHQHRDMTTYRPMVKSKTRAQARADRQLLDVQQQDVRIKTTVTNVLQERVTLLKPGMRVKVKGTHWWPSVDGWHNARVLTAEPRPFGPGRFWDIPVELQVIDPGPDGVVDGPPGPAVSTEGAILYQPFNAPAPPAALFEIRWSTDGDSPGAGYALQPRDATNFDYTGAYLDHTGYEVLASAATLDLVCRISLIDVPGSPRTYTLQIRKNNVPVATGSLTSTGALATGFITATISNLAVVAGDLLTTWMTVNIASGPLVPWGVGDLGNRFEILNTSTIP